MSTSVRTRNLRALIQRLAFDVCVLASGVAIAVGSMTPASVGQQREQAPKGAAKPEPIPELADVPLEKACPQSGQTKLTPENLGRGSESADQVNKLASTIKTCIASLQRAIAKLMVEGGDDVWTKIDSDLNQAILALQARITELKGSGGLIETIKLYINRLKLKKEELPRRIRDKAELVRQSTELQKTIGDTDKSLSTLSGMAEFFNEKIIELESQRPKIASDLTIKEYRRVAEGINDLIKLLEDTNKSLDDILEKNRIPTN